MINHHNRNRGDGNPNAVVIDLLAAKRDRFRRKFGALHPALWVEEAQTELATVTPIRGARRRRMTS